MTKSEMHLFQASLYLSPLIKTDKHVIERQIPMMATEYHKSLLKCAGPLAFVKSVLGLSNETIKAFNIGYCDRKLPLQFPSRKTREGKKLRGGYQRYGLISAETGHEVMRGCITLPMLEDCRLTGMYGLLYDRPQRGVPSARCSLFRETQVFVPFSVRNTALLVESPFAALALAEHGYCNVISLVGNSISEPTIRELEYREITTLVLFGDATSESGADNCDAEMMRSVGIQVCEVPLPFHLNHIGKLSDSQWQLFDKRLSRLLKEKGGRNERYNA